MEKVLILILAGTEIEEGRGRVFTALMMAKELKETGHEVKILFDGAGTEWIPELEEPTHKLHYLYKSVNDVIDGICEFCAEAYGVKDTLPKNIKLRGEYGGHQSYKKYIDEDYEILSF